MDRDYTVFISHAGPDKLTVAIPIRKRLAALNILSFLDKLSLHPGDNGPAVMDYAMATAPIGVFILSPEFPARNWTMRELLTFQHREQDAIVSGTAPPKIIPVFYRLNLRECRDRDLFRLVDDAGQSVFMENAFFDRVLDEKITMRQVFDAMNLVTRRTGVENFDEATNDDSTEMSALREKLIDRIVEAIVSAVETVRNEGGEDKAVTFWRHSLNVSVSAKAPQASSSASSTSASTDSFVRHFEFWPNPSYIHLNLQADTDTPSSPALAKRHLLQPSPHATVLVLQGMPGVGKTTAMRALCHDVDLRSRYSHGVHLISLGAQATPQNVIDALCIALKSAGSAAMVAKLGPHLSLKATVTAVASWFARRAVLWLVDDLWHTDAGAFGGELIDALARVVAAGADAALVVSTREKGLLMHRSVTHRVRLLSHLPQDSFARGILLRAAFGDPAVILSPASEQLLHDLLSSCAGLPIVLSAIGRSVGRVALDVDEDPDRALRAYCSIRTDESLTVSALDQDVDGYTSFCPVNLFCDPAHEESFAKSRRTGAVAALVRGDAPRAMYPSKAAVGTIDNFEPCMGLAVWT